LITAIKGDLTHAVATEAADILKRRPKDAAKPLMGLVENVEGRHELGRKNGSLWKSQTSAITALPLQKAPPKKRSDERFARAGSHHRKCEKSEPNRLHPPRRV
jgi:hypothetical protein